MTNMTLEQAHKILHPDTSRDAIIEISEADTSKDNAIAEVEEACIIACKALEKQIPKRLLFIEGNRDYQCPTCKSLYENPQNDGILCCAICGQKLDWSEVNG